jgi:enoyl-CoA hydratase/carnithine racemase
MGPSLASVVALALALEPEVQGEEEALELALAQEGVGEEEALALAPAQEVGAAEASVREAEESAQAEAEESAPSSFAGEKRASGCCTASAKLAFRPKSPRPASCV